MGRTFRRFGLTILFVVLAITISAAPARAVNPDDPDTLWPGPRWPLPETIEPGDVGPWVGRLQIRLADAGFRPGTLDGKYGKGTLGAVYAFQKIHNLPRDGVFRSEYWNLLEVEVSLPASAIDPNRIEVDLEDQVLYVIRNDKVEVILPISSGSGDTYTGRGGTPVRARTPEGTFSFERHISGWRISYLGALYNPFYFYGGYAIHGSRSVPPYPASHGCVRVEMHDMDHLLTELSLGMPIHVYGNAVDRSELLPPPPPKPTLTVPVA